MKKVVLHILIGFLLFFSMGAAFAQSAPLIIEVTGTVEKPLSPEKLVNICEKHHIASDAVYRWQNHLVIYNAPQNDPTLKNEIAAAYTHISIKVYVKPFYHFDRKLRCKGAGIAKARTNILLTADLVKDRKLQQEYLHYHATQFQKWPEVSHGFCNADFQQLLVYRNGRQLMLVISIPKGKTLDELNPRTTQNNPRVDQWNAIMKKYQEGLPGTKPGEVWVFLKPVKTR